MNVFKYQRLQYHLKFFSFKLRLDCRSYAKYKAVKKSFKNMPKLNNDDSEINDQKVKSKYASHKKLFAPSEMYLCVLGNGSSNSSRALYMFTDHGRYLFNCGEGTQRLAHEHKMKLSKLDHIFITHKSWNNLGGLLGLYLTVQEMGVTELNLHGPTGVDLIFQGTDSFIAKKNLKIVSKNDFDKGFVDGCMQVQYIPIAATKNYKPYYTTDMYGSAEEHAAKRIKIENSIEMKNSETKKELDAEMIVAYGCKGHSKPGHLQIEKCIEEGVPPGPLLGDLKNGKDVVLPDGKIVFSKDVVSEEQQCPTFLVVECPSEKFLDNFVEEKKFKKYQTGTPQSSYLAALVVHFTPSEILKSEKYQEWIGRFPDTTCHLIINSDNASLCSVAIHRIQHKLHLLHPDIFPLLHEREAESVNKIAKENVIQANTLDRYILRPAKGLDRSLNLKIDPQVFIDEALNTEGFKDCLENLKICIQESLEMPQYGSHLPEVYFLGTGSCIPNKVRNVSAILVRTCKYEYFLLDCGEGTCGQLRRLLGDKFNFVLKRLMAIFISHAHADHHLGLLEVLKARKEAYKGDEDMYISLKVIGPIKVKSWLENYNKNVEDIFTLYSFMNAAIVQYNYGIYVEKGEVARFTFYDIAISTVLVDHCAEAYGIILSDIYLKWKLVYSGDTMPCDKLVMAGNKCTLLIHEATMEDELEEEAVLKKHSTTSQAIEIGERMEAQHTILTHFSQRYAKVPVINENFSSRVGCAFDNMRVSRKEYHILPLLIPALKCLFAEEVREMKEKGDKRRKKQELISQMAVE